MTARDDMSERAILHLSLALAAVLFVLFMLMEDVERLKRITRPRMIFVASPHEKAPAPMDAEPALDGEFEVS